MTPLDELATILKPAAGGLYLVSTGKAEQYEVQRQLYGVDSEVEIRDAFLKSLEGIASARGVLLGVPSDVGAGFQRGANLGPQGIRQTVLKQHPAWREMSKARGLVDIGDVFCVPQLQHDEMLSDEQLEQSRAALYPNLPKSERDGLPVSPLSIAERAWDLVFKLNPKVKPFALGGDHSTAWPLVAALARTRGQDWAIVQSDAHTDLLHERLGVKYCFATWSYHANDLLGRAGKLTQVGIRATGRTKQHWEGTLGVKQFWARDVLASPAQQLDEVMAHLESTGVKAVYFSNDIDGTDSSIADATGTPEPDGLTPEWLLELLHRMSKRFELLGGDVMEVAPSLTRTPQSAPRTLALAARYLTETLDAALGRV